MRHRVSGFKLNRDKDARKALLANLASSVLEKGAITTTQTKAKFVKPYVERLITDAKKNRLATTRKLASKLTSPAFKRLTVEIAPGFKQRVGGYTRIIKTTRRQGDGTFLSKLEILEWEKTKTPIKTEKKSAKKKIKAAKKQIKKETKTAKKEVKQTKTKSK